MSLNKNCQELPQYLFMKLHKRIDTYKRTQNQNFSFRISHIFGTGVEVTLPSTISLN